MKINIDNSFNPRSGCIAMIGMGCRLPGGVDSPNALKFFLDNQGDGITEVPKDRFDTDIHYSPHGKDDEGDGKVYVKHGGFLKQDIFEFDPEPFGISPREAGAMDPQQRILLESTWEALEDARLRVDKLRGSNTCVYVGSMTQDAKHLVDTERNHHLMNHHTVSGTAATILSSRLSYVFDWRGPCMTIDTACSSSLVAVHQACEALFSGESDLAVAAGVNVILTKGGTLFMCNGKFLSPDGRCKSFEANGDGFGRAEGAGVVVLKRLEDALRDGDDIKATIRGSGVNFDGRTEGISLPNGHAQAELASSVLKKAGLTPSDVSYVEAHGTGTKVGDPIEVRAIGKAYRQAVDSRIHPLFIGSVKSNIGHLEGGAGVVGLIKLAQAIHSQVLLPQKKLRKPNPAIPFDDLNIRVVQEPTPWPDKSRRIGAVNSFGFGGTNANVIVGDVESSICDLGCKLGQDSSGTKNINDSSAMESKPPLLAITGASVQAAQSYAGKVAKFLEEEGRQFTVEEVAAALANERSHLEHRFACWPSSREEAVRVLKQYSQGKQDKANNCSSGRAVQGNGNKKVLFCFTGMGPQWWGMAHELYANEPIFKSVLDECDQYFKEAAGWSLLEEMLRDEKESEMHTNRCAQPANFFLQAGLQAVFTKRFGVHAEGYLGHSIGEVAAAYAAGALSLEEGVKLSYHRSQAQDQVANQGQTMMAASISAKRAKELIGGKPLDIASYNAPESVAIAGDKHLLNELAENLEKEGVFARVMNVQVAYHSRQMDSLQQDLMTRLSQLHASAPECPLFSTMKGGRTEEAPGPEYWWANVRQPVLFQQALEAALDEGYNMIVEIGPHPVLRHSIKEVATSHDVSIQTFLSLHRKMPSDESLRSTVASLFCNGKEVEWAPNCPRAEVNLPTYPFQRKRHWQLETEASMSERCGRGTGSHPMMQRQVHDGASDYAATFDLRSGGLGWVHGHQVDDRVVFPGAGYVEAMVAACRENSGEGGDKALSTKTVLENVKFKSPLVVGTEASIPRVQVTISGHGRSQTAVVATTTLQGSTTEHASAEIQSMKLQDVVSFTCPSSDLLDQECTRLEIETLYRTLESKGLCYIGDFRCVEALWVDQDGVVTAKILVPRHAYHNGYALHPAVLDAALHALLGSNLQDELIHSSVVPVSMDRVIVTGCCTSKHVWARGSAEVLRNGQMRIANLQVIDDKNREVLVTCSNIICSPVQQEQRKMSQLERNWLYREGWQQVDLSSESASLRATRWAIVGPMNPRLHEIIDALSEFANVHQLQDKDSVSGYQHVIVAANDGDQGGMRRLLRMSQECQRSGLSLRITVLTQGAYSYNSATSPDPYQGGVVGLARTIMIELPQILFRVVDVPPDGSATAADVVSAIVSESEEEVCVSDKGVVLARRIMKDPHLKSGLGNDTSLRKSTESGGILCVDEPGTLRSLQVREMQRAPPVLDEVDIAVEANSVNFKDLMKCLGMLPPQALENTYLGYELGMEVVGRVIRKGPDVKTVQIGDRVYVLAPKTMASHVCVSESMTMPLTADADPLEASCRFVFTTAYYSLVDVARLCDGERVLIHSAAGGVGLAAVQIAKLMGAEVFATAGTLAKREYLKTTLGISNVYDSRTVDFADQILKDTNGEGVDVVLNSLAGKAQEASIKLVRVGGRFVEIGKKDIVENESLPLLLFNRSITFSAIDFDKIIFCKHSLKYYIKAVKSVWELFSSGKLKPLPIEVFLADQYVDAFARLRTGEVIGKIVLDHRASSFKPTLPAEGPPIKSSATYLVTGGLGGLGLITAEWLASRGAGRIVLASRRGGPANQGDQASVVIKRLQMMGVDIQTASLDVGNMDQVKEVINGIDSKLCPLRGVFHLAMVLEDVPIDKLDDNSFNRVMNPKVNGVLNLHEATKDKQLDHFVLFSSAVSMLGNRSQAAYSAANGFLDAFAHHRRKKLKLPALSVNFGGIAEIGVAARDQSLVHLMENRGTFLIPPSRALIAMEAAMKESFTCIGIFDVKWGRWKRFTAPTPWRRLELLDDQETDTSAEKESSFPQRILRQGPSQRSTEVLREVSAVVSSVLGTQPESLDVEKAITDFGVDSLMAAELHFEMQQQLQLEFTVMELLSGRSVASLAGVALQRIESLVTETPADLTEASGTKKKSSPSPSREAREHDEEKKQECVEVVEVEDLSDYFLSRICVTRPYFALERVQKGQDSWFYATCHPVPPSAMEDSPVGHAETCRHLAILGSCCVREDINAPGKIYFPVRHGVRLSVEKDGEHRRSPRNTKTIQIRARTIEVDLKAGLARVVAESLNEDGLPFFRSKVTYSIIQEPAFQTLFKRHYREPLPTVLDEDPYGYANRHLFENLPEPKPLEGRNDEWTLDLGVVEASKCVGHFNGYPAFPVSIMGRCAVVCLGKIIRKVAGDDSIKLQLKNDVVEADRFIWAGESANLVAKKTTDNGSVVWKIHVMSEASKEPAATFSLELGTE